jgi:regulator of nucleoside diphosphate kinase
MARVCPRQTPALPLKDRLVESLCLERTLTELDHVRLLSLLRRDALADASAPPRRILEDVLDASALVPSREVAPDVVTMHSQVLLQDLQTGERSMLTLCFPAETDAASGFVSVLSPVGSALLGLRVGSVARWSGPSGSESAAEILAVPYQPESRGHYTM